jgi:hypothetical protein
MTKVVRGTYDNPYGIGLKFHILFHQSRSYPGMGVPNCGRGLGFILKMDSEDFIVKRNMCKSCLRGPTKFVQQVYGGLT